MKKVIWSESGEKYAQIKHCLEAKAVQNMLLVDLDVRGQQEMVFFTEESVFMDFGKKQWLLS